MELNIKMTYLVELTPQEFRVVSSALTGSLKPEWKEEAVELQDKLFQARNKQVKTLLGNIERMETKSS